ncbi:hypothetical protein F751_4744 [Auxenochlorella protothecoides]|uniref:Uncharacterized protein n=2 Tax=Auxenochlorella protothecoides TaxID=3075 RepID=A0A087SKJ7_AUXPR|nr:hypothetical protein F751_4744 [Auxenochlorella protothecoides]KFM26251.1 hypothetical protein F751_4744 [Auxenochlorella protothecoides]
MTMQVVIEYGKGDVNQFLALADEIEDAFPKLVVEGQENLELQKTLSVALEGEASIWQAPLPIPDASDLLKVLQAELEKPLPSAGDTSAWTESWY